MSGGGLGPGWSHRAHAAAPPRRAHRGGAHCRGTERRAGARSRLCRALRRAHFGGNRRQGDDRRPAAERDPARPQARPLRVRDRGRSPRTQPERRFHPRQPAAAARLPAGFQGRRHQRHHRRAGVRQALRRCAGGAGERTRLSGGGGLSRRRGRFGRRSAGLRGDDHPRRTGGKARHPRLPVRRAGNLRQRAPAQTRLRRPLGHPAAVCPPASRRTAARVRARPEAARGAGHQRRRNQHHRAEHRLRRRSGPRPHQPLQLPRQAATPAHRADFPSQRPTTRRTLRAHRARRLLPPLRRAGLRLAAGLHRSRNQTHQSGRRGAGYAGVPPRGHGQVPVRRSTRPARGARRGAPAARTASAGERRTHRDRAGDGAAAGGSALGADARRGGANGFSGGGADRGLRPCFPGPALAPA